MKISKTQMQPLFYRSSERLGLDSYRKRRKGRSIGVTKLVSKKNTA